MGDEKDRKILEREYMRGNKRAYTSMLRECLRNLGVDDPTEVRRLAWVMERNEAIEQLRDLCGEFGDNDWPDELSLADIIEIHLGRHLRE